MEDVHVVVKRCDIGKVRYCKDTDLIKIIRNLMLPLAVRTLAVAKNFGYKFRQHLEGKLKQSTTTLERQIFCDGRIFSCCFRNDM